MPSMGIGTCCRAGSRGPELLHSLDAFFMAGGRLVDTAASYKNHGDIARAVHNYTHRGGGRKRDDLWITSKVDTIRDEGGRKGVRRSINRALAQLKMERVDLMLLHHPQCRLAKGDAPFATEADCIRSSWRGLADAQRTGRTRAIGVSNFGVAQLESLLAAEEGEPALPVPAVNQIELHPWYQSAEVTRLIDFCRRRGIQLTAFNSLGGATLSANWSSVKIQIGRPGVSTAQLLLRWAIDGGAAVVPGATSREHIEENLKACDIEPLSTSERDAITAMPKPVGWRNRAILGKVKHPVSNRALVEPQADQQQERSGGAVNLWQTIRACVNWARSLG